MDSQRYFEMLRHDLERAYSVASEARKLGLDPSNEVEVKIAKDVAARVEGIVGPPGIAETIRSLEAGGMPREDIAFDISRRIASGEFIKGNKEALIEQAVRTGLGIITEGVLVAPTEGISKIKIKQNPDASNYVAVYFAGPIRSAGGTAAALSLVLADIARRECGVGDYRATDSQIKRYIEEVNVYEGRVSHLQYMPPEEHITVLAGNCPICIDGDPTEDIEVSAYRGVPGVETDRVRGGVPLVLCEGLAAKAAKVLKYTRRLNLGWDWLEKVIKIKKKADKTEIKPDTTYLEGLVAGRPVFAHASAKGGFRLRYGRSKTNSLMAKNIHPALMILVDNFLAFGTQMKIERPGKGCVVAAYDMMEPPVVRLKSGRVMKVRTIEEAKSVKPEVAEIMFLGDMLCAYGDFLKTNHPLMPSGYCEEWWLKELEAKGLSPPSGNMDAAELLLFSKLHNVPLHPRFTFHWHDISAAQLKDLAFWLVKGQIKTENGKLVSLSLPANDPAKRILEELLVEHDVQNGQLVIGGDEALILLSSIGVWNEKSVSPGATQGSETQNKQADDSFQAQAQQPVLDLFAFNNVWSDSAKALDIINMFVRTKAKSPIYIGARMGRPEKAKERAMDGKPQVLFPTGSFKNRSMTKQYRTLKSREGEKTINLDLVRMRCTKCNSVGFYRRCEVCGGSCVMENICQQCGNRVDGPMHCDMKTVSFDERPVDLVVLYETVKTRLGISPEDVKGVKGLTNPTHIPERLEKGFLRAKHDVFVFRDGTSRFDATDVPLTHFTPKEIGIDVETAKKLGYERDYLGNELTDPTQLLSLRHQDIVLSDNGAVYFMRVAAFIDEMLINLYGIKPFYNIKTKNDLIGQLAVGLSPHTSAGALCRIIGFTKANVGYGHPYFHTAKRRNCDADEDSIMLLMDCLLNFSRKYLNESRGGTMDAPLVLSIEINPKEVDDEAHCIEMVSHYPLEFYEAAERYAQPGEVKIRTVKDVLGTEEQFELPITHTGGSIDEGVVRSAYVELASIPEKIDIQFSLQERIRAVDKRDAAERLIMSHFIPDLYGNLRSFSRQTFRCVNCNTIFRRTPLAGKCSRCGGNLLLTINKGGIEKYLSITSDIVKRYDLPPYLSQRLELLAKEIRSIFEDDQSKQMGLSDFL